MTPIPVIPLGGFEIALHLMGVILVAIALPVVAILRRRRSRRYAESVDAMFSESRKRAHEWNDSYLVGIRSGMTRREASEAASEATGWTPPA